MAITLSRGGFQGEVAITFARGALQGHEEYFLPIWHVPNLIGSIKIIWYYPAFHFMASIKKSYYLYWFIFSYSSKFNTLYYLIGHHAPIFIRVINKYGIFYGFLLLSIDLTPINPFLPHHKVYGVKLVLIRLLTFKITIRLISTEGKNE